MIFIGSIENLPVEFEGDTYTLQEIAQIGRKGSQLLVVNLSGFPTVMKDVLKAINDSGMGLNPQQDGTTIFIPIPKYSFKLKKKKKLLLDVINHNIIFQIGLRESIVKTSQRMPKLCSKNLRIIAVTSKIDTSAK